MNLSSEQPIKNRDVIIIGLQAWDEAIGSNCKDLALQFKNYNRVLYVNYPINRQMLWKKDPDKSIVQRKEVLKGNIPEIIQLEENFWVLTPKAIMEPSNWIKIPILFDLLNRYNNFKFSTRIKKAVDNLRFNNFILFNDQDIYRGFYLPEMLKPDKFIYYIRDNLLGVDFFKLHGSRLEPKLIDKADLVVCNSIYLQNYAKKYTKKAFYVGQGCDLSIFNPNLDYSIPNLLYGIKKPIIGYVGALASHRLDRDLLIYIAQNKPEWNLVLVGPEDEGFRISLLHKFENVYFLGNQPMENLPNYITHFDVCINPQILNEITIGNYPRKVDEYLALGKPVVALKTETMEFFSKYVYLAKDPNDFVNEIQRALKEDLFKLKNERIQFASEHTWANSYFAISEAFFKTDNISYSLSPQ